jgi:CHAT domain-containing protein
MTVSSLFETNIYDQRPFLAYLSACGTGQVKHSELMDEGLHLITACQLAGFQHVIGTLWEVNDKSCVDMALKTYKWIIDQGMSHASVSEGLHHASR